MNQQHDRIVALCEQLKLDRLGVEWPALAQDAQICMAAAERVAEGEILADADKSAAHEACQRALAESSNVVQKYHLQEADFDIMGTRPKQ